MTKKDLKPKSKNERRIEAVATKITLVRRTNNENELQVLHKLLDNAKEKMIQLDKTRQTNFNFSLLIFGGLFGIGIKFEPIFSKFLISGAIILLMLIFTALDRRLHKYRHGWQETYNQFFKYISEFLKIGNDQEFEVITYCATGEKNAEWFSLQPWLYYSLIIGGVFSIIIYSVQAHSG